MVTKAEDPIKEAEPTVVEQAKDVVVSTVEAVKYYARLFLTGSRKAPVRRPFLFVLVILALVLNVESIGLIALGLLMLTDAFAAEE